MKQMKKTAMLFCSTICTIAAFGQEVVSPQGDSYVKPEAQVDFTIGEPVIITGDNGDSEITQGFHQTFWQITKVESIKADFVASLFPNPTIDLINVKTSAFQDVNYQLFDATGKVVLSGKLTSDQTSIAADQLAAGNYTLLLSNSTEKLKSFTLIKLK